MKQSEIKELSIVDLQDKIVEEKKAYNSMSVSHKVTQLENPISIRNARRLIARLSTELRTKQLQG